ACDKLFDLFSARTRPGCDDQRLLRRNVRVLSLRHVGVSIDAPDNCANQQHPGDLRIFYAETGGVMSFSNQILFLVVSRRRHGITSTLSPSVMRVAPETTTRSPNFTP